MFQLRNLQLWLQVVSIGAALTLQVCRPAIPNLRLISALVLPTPVPRTLEPGAFMLAYARQYSVDSPLEPTILLRRRISLDQVKAIQQVMSGGSSSINAVEKDFDLILIGGDFTATILWIGGGGPPPTFHDLAQLPHLHYFLVIFGLKSARAQLATVGINDQQFAKVLALIPDATHLATVPTRTKPLGMSDAALAIANTLYPSDSGIAPQVYLTATRAETNTAIAGSVTQVISTTFVTIVLKGQFRGLSPGYTDATGLIEPTEYLLVTYERESKTPQGFGRQIQNTQVLSETLANATIERL